jgi:hypothetical protein
MTQTWWVESTKRRKELILVVSQSFKRNHCGHSSHKGEAMNMKENFKKKKANGKPHPQFVTMLSSGENFRLYRLNQP